MFEVSPGVHNFDGGVIVIKIITMHSYSPLERTLNMWAYLVLGQKRERKRKEEKGVVVG